MTVVTAIKETLNRFAPDQRFLLGCSGGLDSIALLHALHALSGARALPIPLRVVHVDHGLQAPSAMWAAQVVQQCQALQIDVVVKNVVVAAGNLEAEARRARYAAYREVIAADEVLILAHHQQDQAETVLMRLLSGSGVSGLAAMPELQVYDGLRILRPWLAVSRADIHQFAVNHHLQWVDDPANDDLHYARARLRQQVWPLLAEHWPGFEAAMARTAQHMADAESVLRAQGIQDLALCQTASGALNIAQVTVLPVARIRWLLARWMQGAEPYPPALSRVEALRQIMVAREDATPVVAWQAIDQAWQFRRFQGLLYRLPEALPVAGVEQHRLAMDDVLTLASGQWRVTGQTQGLPMALLGQPLLLRPRLHGEVLHLSGRVGRWPLKKLLQSLALPPWARAQVYVLESDEGRPLALLSAVGFSLMHGEAVEAGWGLVLQPEPPLSVNG